MWPHLEVRHEVSEDWRVFLLQQTLQADDERNRVLYEGLLLDLWKKQNRTFSRDCPSDGQRKESVFTC